MEFSEVITIVAEIAKQREKIFRLRKIIDYLRKRIQEIKERTDECI